MKRSGYVKIVGIKFDALNGVEVVADANRSTFSEAGQYAETHHGSDNIIWIGIPCECTYNK